MATRGCYTAIFNMSAKEGMLIGTSFLAFGFFFYHFENYPLMEHNKEMAKRPYTVAAAIEAGQYRSSVQVKETGPKYPLLSR